MSNVIPAEIPDYYRAPSHIAPPALPSSIGRLLIARQQETQLQWQDETGSEKKTGSLPHWEIGWVKLWVELSKAQQGYSRNIRRFSKKKKRVTEANTVISDQIIQHSIHPTKVQRIWMSSKGSLQNIWLKIPEVYRKLCYWTLVMHKSNCENFWKILSNILYLVVFN